MEVLFSPRVRVFRYRELLLVLVLVAVSAWAFSRPSQEAEFQEPALLVTVLPGQTLDDTVFDVHYKGPERYRPWKGSLSFRLEGAGSETVGFKQVEELSPGQWRVRGRDMVGEQTFFQDGRPAKPRVGRTSRWTALMSAHDPDASRHSRGSKLLLIKSRRFELSLR